MNVGQLLQKIKDLITAFKAQDYLAAAMLAWEIVQAFLNSIPKNELGKPRVMHASYSASIDECVDELEELTKHPTVANAAPTDKVDSPIIALLLPIIAKLVLKWLGM